MQFIIDIDKQLPISVITLIDIHKSRTFIDDLVTFSLSFRRYKPPVIHYRPTYRNIKNIEVIEFDCRLRASSEVVDPARL